MPAKVDAAILAALVVAFGAAAAGAVSGPGPNNHRVLSYRPVQRIRRDRVRRGSPGARMV